MNKKIIGIMSAVTLLGGAVYLSGQGGFGGLSSSVLTGDACTQAGLDAQKDQYEASSDQIASLEEQMSSLEDSISSAEESIATYQTNVVNKKQEIKNTNQEVNQLENYIRSQCGVKKQSRGGQVNYSAPDCNPKKNQVANKKQQINNLERSVKNTNNVIQTAQRNIKNNQTKLGQLENELSNKEQFVEDYETCQQSLPVVPETGGDLPPVTPESGGDLPPVTPETGGDLSLYVPETGGDLPPSTTPETEEDSSSITPETKTDGSVTPVLTTVEEVNKEIKSLVLEINTARGNITPEKMQNIANRFDILNKTKSEIENNPSASNKETELASAEKLYAEVATQASQSRYVWDYVLVPRQKDLQAKEWDLDAKIAAAKNQNQKQDLTKKRQEIREKIKANNVEMAKYLNEAKQTNLQMTQLQLSIQEIKSKTVVVPRIEQDFFDAVQMIVESFRTGEDNEKCDQHTYLGSILPQVDATVPDSSLQYPETRIISFMKTPLPATQLAEAKSLYSEIQPVLLNLKNSITTYDTQRADYMKKIAYELSKVPSYCLQLDKKIKADRELLPKNDEVYSSRRKQVIVLERFITWMDQNHFTGNN